MKLQLPFMKALIFRASFILFFLGFAVSWGNAQNDRHPQVVIPENFPMYVVKYNGNSNTYMESLRSMGNVIVGRQTKNLQYVSIIASESDVATIKAMSNTVEVYKDEFFTFNLAESHAQTQALIAQQASSAGAGCAIAVLDSGINKDHCMFAGKIPASACFSESYSFPGGIFPTIPNGFTATSACPNGGPAQFSSDGSAAATCDVFQYFCDHGSHVAGIAAGRPCSGTLFGSGAPHTSPGGVAPGADIVPVNVFSLFAGDFSGILSCGFDQLLALEWVLDNKDTYGICAVNMSLGGGFNSSFCNMAFIAEAVDMLRQAGVATVIATGNNGFNNGISSPACIESAIAVGAIDDAGNEAVFSNNLDGLVDLMAPGVGITSADSPDGAIINSFITFNGTSMATPTVAGAFLILQAQCPDATVDQIESALKVTGADVPGISAKSIRINDALHRLIQATHIIPTMSEWGLMIFGLLVLNLSVFAIRRRENLLS